MKVTSSFPFGHLCFRHWHTDGSEVGVIVAKAQFQRSGPDTFRGLSKPPNIVLDDTFAGDPGTSPLQQEQDLAPGKIGADIQILGVARKSGGQAVTDWPVQIDVERRLNYAFQVRGPSFWEPNGTGWALSAPEPVTAVPLTYSLAYGGTSLGKENELVATSENPAGIGFVTPERLQRRDPFPAPQIGDLAEFISARPDKPMTVHGTAPIAKAWLPRRAHAGTFDDAWKQERHPRMPHDYSLRFWNAAPAALQCAEALDGDELITVSGVSFTDSKVVARLPSLQVWVDFSGDARATVGLVLDTVQLDLRSEAPGDHLMTLIWRGHVAEPDRFDAAEIFAERVQFAESA
ncbi:MAG: DUF2169 domain-containing protein [Pseudomonadota bacterium]